MRLLTLTFILIFLTGLFHDTIAFQGIDNPKVKWRFKTEGPIRGDAVISGQHIYFGSSDGHLYALTKADGNLLWKFKTNGSITGSPALSEDTAYISSRDNHLYAIDIISGEQKWAFKMQPILPDGHAGWDYFMPAPVISGNQLFIGSGDGHLYSLDPESGNLNWDFKTNGRIRATLLVHEETIYQPSNDGYVYVLNATDGELLWKFETRGATYNPDDFGFDRSSIFTQPIIVDHKLVFGSRDGNVYAVNLNNREEEWSFTYGTTWAMSAEISEGVVYVGWSTNNLFSAIDLETGEEIWQQQSGSHVYSKPLVLDSNVYIGSADGILTKHNKHTGEVIWEYPVNSEIYSSPLYDSGILFFGSDNGFYYALENRADARMAVYQPETIEGNAQYLVVDQKISPYLTDRGFEQVDEMSLESFLNDRIIDKNPSVVVFALPIIPNEVIGSSPESGLMRQYLDSGGKVVWMGDIPNFYAPDSTGNFSRNATVGTQLLDVEFANPTESGNYFSKPTQVGLNWGLPDWIKTTNSTVEAGEGVIPLAYDEFGRISLWVKKFNPRPGSGFVSARTWSWNVPIREMDLELIYKLAMHELE